MGNPMVSLCWFGKFLVYSVCFSFSFCIKTTMTEYRRVVWTTSKKMSFSASLEKFMNRKLTVD